MAKIGEKKFSIEKPAAFLTPLTKYLKYGQYGCQNFPNTLENSNSTTKPIKNQVNLEFHQNFKLSLKKFPMISRKKHFLAVLLELLNSSYFKPHKQFLYLSSNKIIVSSDQMSHIFCRFELLMLVFIQKPSCIPYTMRHIIRTASPRELVTSHGGILEKG